MASRSTPRASPRRPSSLARFPTTRRCRRPRLASPRYLHLERHDAFTKYGVDQTVPKSNINEIWNEHHESTCLIQPQARFRNLPASPPISIRVIIATPKGCDRHGACPAGFPAPSKCAPWWCSARLGAAAPHARDPRRVRGKGIRGKTVAIDPRGKPTGTARSTGGQVTTINGITCPMWNAGSPVACITTLSAGAQVM